MPGTPLAARAEDDRIPVLLVQRTIMSESVSIGSRSGAASNVPLAGWTLLVPSGWGSAFWHSLVYADTRVGGLRERGQQIYEAGCPSFPEDFPCTTAYKQDMDVRAREAKLSWERKPPAKRVNFQKLDTRSPWRPDLDQVARDAVNAIAGQSEPQAGMDIDQTVGEEAAGSSSPWLLSGPLVQKIFDGMKANGLDAGPKSLSDVDELDQIVLDIIQHERGKRLLDPLPQGKAKDLAKRAIVRVAVTPVNRGTPKFNAMIYRMDEEQARELKARLAASNRDMDVKAIIEKVGKDAAYYDADEDKDGEEIEEEEIHGEANVSYACKRIRGGEELICRCINRL